MSDDRCPHCQTPYIGDLDENGNPFCDCEGSRIADLQAEIERLREAQRWIPVGERLPEDPTSDDDDTFICLIRGISFYGDVYLVTKVLRFYGEKFYSIGHFSTDWTDQVVAWMPLPEPPQQAEG